MVERIHICRTIARERRRLGITQEALAAHLGVSKAAVSKWELDKRRKPRPNALDERSHSMLLSVLDASPTTKQSVAARLGLLAGLRREEVSALKWGDVDLAANRIRVCRAVGVSNGRPYLI